MGMNRLDVISARPFYKQIWFLDSGASGCSAPIFYNFFAFSRSRDFLLFFLELFYQSLTAKENDHET